MIEEFPAQGSAQWIQERLGRVTASRIVDVIAMTKKGPSEKRETYMMELLAERLTGMAADHFTSKAMEWGTEMEAQAADAYAFFFNADVMPAPFVLHPSIPFSGASPDRYVNDDGLVEFKCLISRKHAALLLAGEIPEEHLPQMHWQMACTGRSWCDFGGFDPRMPERLKLFTKRLDRDAEVISEYEQKVGEFLAELDERVRLVDPTNYSLAAVSARGKELAG